MPVRPPSPGDLARMILATGFSCRSCGACCRQAGKDSNLVMAAPAELAAIVHAAGLSREAIAEPYPEFVDGPGGSQITFGWCLRRTGDACAFLEAGNRCRIYAVRPWICRTYPFMLADGDLVVSECPGVGGAISEADAHALADELLARARAEEAERRDTAVRYRCAAVPPGARAVIDPDGVTLL
ncbi:MAG: YkgJ family cysteine cluster protein [Methanomicrobiales archaeon]|nr:YkgJ family cysteine cluster protein [Methanomicrobiales archaeon]